MALNVDPNNYLEFGDRIIVSTPAGTPINGTGIFVSLEGETLVWVALGVGGPFAGEPTLYVTNIEGHSVQKLT